MEKKQVIQFVVRDDGILPWSPCFIYRGDVGIIIGKGVCQKNSLVLDKVSHALPV